MSKVYALASQHEPLLREDRDGIATLTLNRPAARNALSLALIEAFGDALAAIAADRSVRAVVIAANGPVFSAGHDLKELTAHRADPDKGRDFFRRTFGECAAMMQAIVHLPQPVIACVHGLATAAGCQLAASCDLVVASEAAEFATPGVNIGFFCSTPMVALSRKVPSNQAMEMLLTGEPISAKRARKIGLVNRVTKAGEERARKRWHSRKPSPRSRPTSRRSARPRSIASASSGLARPTPIRWTWRWTTCSPATPPRASAPSSRSASRSGKTGESFFFPPPPFREGGAASEASRAGVG